MSNAAPELKLIRDAAAGWFAKLNNSTVSTDTLRAFRAWRNSDPLHDEAYLDIEAFWRRAAELEADAEIQRAAGAALERDKGLPVGKSVAGLVLVLLLAGGGALAWPSLFGRTYSTGVGEQRLVTLADGSRVRLDTRSKVRVILRREARTIDLEAGRAFFDVAHDAARPFVVRADATRVFALGTRFDVRRSPGGVDVVLVEGRVRVEGQTGGHPARWALDPGQTLRSGAATGGQIRRIDAAQATSWTSGRLVFRSQPLADAIAEVNRYSRRPIVLEDPGLAARPVSGSFEIGDVDGFVSAVCDLYGLKVSAQDKAIVLQPAG